MNKIVSILSFMLLACGIQACAQKESENPQTMKDKNVLVVFYSRIGDNYAVGNISKGNTHIVAEMIADKTGGRLFEIEPVNPYPSEYTPTTEVALEEKNSNARPAIKNKVENWDDYDVVFIGCPVWWWTTPMIIHTFAETYDFKGKTVVPFCTYASTYRDETLAEIARITPDAAHLQGLGLTSGQISESRISTWLKDIKVVK